MRKSLKRKHFLSKEVDRDAVVKEILAGTSTQHLMRKFDLADSTISAYRVAIRKLTEDDTIPYSFFKTKYCLGEKMYGTIRRVLADISSPEVTLSPITSNQDDPYMKLESAMEALKQAMGDVVEHELKTKVTELESKYKQKIDDLEVIADEAKKSNIGHWLKQRLSGVAQ